jgi:hypothetical protein
MGNKLPLSNNKRIFTIKRIISMVLAISLIAGCGKTAKLANIVETPVEVVEEVNSGGTEGASC